MEIDYNLIRIGDRLIRTKGGILSKHHVIYAGFWNKQHLVAENQNGVGVRYIPLNQFLSEGILDRVEYNDFTENAQIEIIDRINNKIGSRYNLLKYNCEHFVNEILTGIKKSKQIQTGIILGVGVSLCLLAFGSINEK